MPLRDVVDLTCECLPMPLGLDVDRPRLGWKLCGDGPVRQSAYRVRVSTAPDPAAADVWDSGRVASDACVNVIYTGEPLASRQWYWWDVTVFAVDGSSATSAATWWETGLLSADDFDAPWINVGRTHVSWSAKVLPAPLLRYGFTLPAAVRSARAYVCGLGYHELYVNGRRVGDRVLEPNVSQYDRRARYVTSDVTDLLQAGDNAIGVILGNGWYNPHTSDVWHFDKAPWRDYPKLWLRLDVTLADGSHVLLKSDAAWKTAESAITFDGLRNGETFDARLDTPGWAAAGFDDSTWPAAVVVPGPGGVLTSQWGPACHVAETLPAVDRREVDGAIVFDFGQNVTGHARVRIGGAAGQTLTLQYAETIKDDGTLDTTDTARFIKSGDAQTDRFTPATDATETWEPRFTYHGFRYVRVVDLPASATLAIDARVVETELPSAGDFVSSDDVLDRIHAATRRSFRGNFTGIPTDCPHREKNGWTGDAQLAVETGLLNFRVGPAYRDWIETVVDAQRPSGQLPGIVPSGGWGYNWGSGPAWDAALLVIPWNVYVYTADDAMIRRHYLAMRKYVEFCRTLASDHIVGFGLGDWCHVDRDRIAPVPLTSTSYYYVCARLLSRFAGMVSERDAAARYARLADDIRTAFNARFYRGDGVYGDGSATALACAVYQGSDAGAALVEDAERPRVVERLVDAVKAAGVKPDFGILGAKWVPRALAENGQVDLAYRLLTQRDYPGWAYWIENGATTLYETWDGRASRNHIMFGDIDAWMFHYVAGLRPDAAHAGFAHTTVRPHFVAGLNVFDAWHDTPYGRLRSAWRRDGDAVRLRVTVPPNTTATVTLPDGQTAEVGPGDHAFDGQAVCHSD